MGVLVCVEFALAIATPGETAAVAVVLDVLLSTIATLSCLDRIAITSASSGLLTIVHRPHFENSS